MQVTSENLSGPAPFTVYFDVLLGIEDAPNVSVDFGDGSTGTFPATPGELFGVVHTYEQDGTYTARFSHPQHQSVDLEVTVQDDPVPGGGDEDQVQYFLEITVEHSGGATSVGRYPFPAQEPVVEAAEAAAAVYLTYGASEVALIVETTTSNRTILSS